MKLEGRSPEGPGATRPGCRTPQPRSGGHRRPPSKGSTGCPQQTGPGAPDQRRQTALKRLARRGCRWVACRAPLSCPRCGRHSSTSGGLPCRLLSGPQGPFPQTRQPPLAAGPSPHPLVPSFAETCTDTHTWGGGQGEEARRPPGIPAGALTLFFTSGRFLSRGTRTEADPLAVGNRVLLSQSGAEPGAVFEAQR